MKTIQVVITHLDSVDVNAIRLDEAIAYLVGVKLLRAEYEAQKVPEPRYLGDQQMALERRIRDLRYDHMAHRLSQLKAERAANMRPEEREAAREQEIQQLEELLQR